MPLASSTSAMARNGSRRPPRRPLSRRRGEPVAGGLFAQQQRQGVDEDRLAGAGFSGQQVQSQRRTEPPPIDDRVVFNSELDQHRPRPRQRSIARIYSTPTSLTPGLSGDTGFAQDELMLCAIREFPGYQPGSQHGTTQGKLVKLHSPVGVYNRDLRSLQTFRTE